MTSIVNKIHNSYSKDKKIWIKFSIDDSWDSIQGYVHTLEPEFCTIYTEVGPRSVPFSQILKVVTI